MLFYENQELQWMDCVAAQQARICDRFSQPESRLALSQFRRKKNDTASPPVGLHAANLHAFCVKSDVLTARVFRTTKATRNQALSRV